MILLWILGVSAIAMTAVAILLFTLGFVVIDTAIYVAEKIRNSTRFD